MRSLLPTLLVFLFRTFETLLRWGVRRDPPPPSDHLALTPCEQVLELERIRRHRHYKPGWLYHRCRELGLEDTLRELREESVVP